MPLYDCECTTCHARQRYFSRIDDRARTPACNVCGMTTEQRIFTAPGAFMRGNFEAFRSTVDGSIITGDKALREHNARNGVVNLHDVYSDRELESSTTAVRKPLTTDVNDLAQDLYEATQQVAAGYKPTIEVCDE